MMLTAAPSNVQRRWIHAALMMTMMLAAMDTTVVSTVYTLAGDLSSVRERAYIEGWRSSVWGVAASVGPTLGGAFAESAPWR